MKQLIGWFFSPLVFGMAFVGPLVAQILAVLAPEFVADLPVSVLVLGLILGAGIGGMAQWRGSWIWIR